MAETNPKFSIRLREAIKQAGMSQKELAHLVGVREVSISKYAKHGGVPEWNILVKIAQSLNVSCDWLLTGANQSNCSEGQACIDMPEEDPRPLVAAERDVIQKALVVMRSPGLENEPDMTLLNTINALYGVVRQQRAAGGIPADQGGAGKAAGKRGSAREKAAAAAGGARK